MVALIILVVGVVILCSIVGVSKKSTEHIITSYSQAKSLLSPYKMVGLMSLDINIDYVLGICYITLTFKEEELVLRINSLPTADKVIDYIKSLNN